MNAPEDEAPQWRQALTGVTRALSTRGRVSVGSDEAGETGTAEDRAIRVSWPRGSIGADRYRALRGRLDAAAMKLRFHDESLHRHVAPDDGAARALFDRIEQLRVECLGARLMPGVADNLDAALDEHCREHAYHTLQTRRDVAFSEALLLHLLEGLSTRPLPDAACRVIDAWREACVNALAGLLPQLAAALEDQLQYAGAALQLLVRIGLAGEPGAEVPARPALQSPPQRLEDFANVSKERTDLDATVPFAANRGEAVDVRGRKAVLRIRAESESGGVSDGGVALFHSSPQANAAYHVFDTRYDEIVQASELTDATELVALRRALDERLLAHRHLVARLANRLQQCLLAVQRRAWRFDQDEGILDPNRLARAVSDPFHPLSYRQEESHPCRDTVVTLLVDNSGSMSGQRIETAAMCADILARTLERCHVSVEVLGFTTRTWKGGRLREKWIQQGRPRRPGRLNELRHIVYKSADVPWRRAKNGLGLMLDPALPKENIDGEALSWAWRRLMLRPEQRRILLVVCDGEPADEITTDRNGPDFLDMHLREVIRAIERSGTIQLAAIGIGHDVREYYARALSIAKPAELAAALVEQLASVLTDQSSNGLHAGQRRRSA